MRAAKSIVEERNFLLSTNRHDWLGNGAYFFQDAPLRAGIWAERLAENNEGKTDERDDLEPAVVAADIDLGDCLDLLDIKWFRTLARAHEKFLDSELVENLKRSGERIPGQKSPVLHLEPAEEELDERELTWQEKGVGLNALDRNVINFTVELLEDETGSPVRSVRAAFFEGYPVYRTSFFYNRNHVQIAVIDIDSVITNIFELERSKWDIKLCRSVL